MSSIAKTTKRSKKTKRLDPVQVLRPEEYTDFDVETKMECIQALEKQIQALGDQLQFWWSQGLLCGPMTDILRKGLMS